MKIKLKLLLINLWKGLVASFHNFRSVPNLYSFALFIVAAIVIITYQNNDAINDIENFEVGRVADRDVIAAYTVTFVDEAATMALMEAVARQVHAVFRVSSEVNRQIHDSWNEFVDLQDEEFAAVRAYGTEILNTALRRGIFLFQPEDIRHFDPEIAELQYSGTGGERILIHYNDIITMSNVRDELERIVYGKDVPDFFKEIAVDLLMPLLTENAFFSFGDTQRNLEEALETIGPVTRSIERGTRIIRQGFIISETEMEELMAFHMAFPRTDPRSVIGSVLLILLVYLLFIILCGKIIIGRETNNSEKYLLATITGFYIIAAVFLSNMNIGSENFMLALLMPTALFIMIISVFMGTRPAMIMALALPLGTYFAGAYDNFAYIIALVSGIAASVVLHRAQNRMVLIKAGLLIGAANSFAIIVVLLIRQSNLYDYPIMIFWAVLNGIISGMLTLGFLPLLEHALNAVTPFRLLELSDLNAPILRKLFTAAPGTYSHSLMVANLAEQACQDIGANALLARVGAYYHDIGKMENPDYFVENQTDHNRHDEIAPRLSATIIRSHVKLGVEKAYSLGLPKDVISIISEHHGNSVISWFYNKAAEQETSVSSEDFTYPGTPPRSKESAAVMLADITEAAVRTLSKPTAAKIEKFIQQLFEAKIEHGQLSASDLSFRELEIIKKGFVRVLAGYYHSRIEYPDQEREKR